MPAVKAPFVKLHIEESDVSIPLISKKDWSELPVVLELKLLKPPGAILVGPNLLLIGGI